MKIAVAVAVAGTGYVDLSLAVLLAQHNEVVALDLIQDKVDFLNAKNQPIHDAEIQDFLINRSLNLTATLNKKLVYEGANFVVIATPTDYDPEIHCFNTKSIESVISDALEINPNTTMVIKSTIPVGYIQRIRDKFSIDNILFSPEFLREGRALYDNFYPSRIVVGEQYEHAQVFASLLVEGAIKKDMPFYSLMLPKQRPLSSLLISIWQCVLLILMGWIAIAKAIILKLGKLLRGLVWI
jgi:UDPglucose 6-dehydrogenase